MTQVRTLLTAGEVADLLHTSAETVRRWAREKKIPVVTLPSGAVRFRKADIDALLDAA